MEKLIKRDEDVSPSAVAKCATDVHHDMTPFGMVEPAAVRQQVIGGS